MTNYEKQIELGNKIQKSLDTVYAKVVQFKKQKGTNIVIMQDGKIIQIKPQ